jgi:hypothetical protein
MRYIEDIAHNILGLVENPAKRDTPTVIANTLGFAYGRPITRWRILTLDYHLFDRYKSLRLQGMLGPAALRKLADEFPSSVETIRRRLKNFARINTAKNPDDLLEIQQALDLDLEPHSLVAETGYADRAFNCSTTPNRSEKPRASILTGPQILMALDCEQLIITPRPKPEYICSRGIVLTADETHKFTSCIPPKNFADIRTREFIDFPNTSGFRGRLRNIRSLDDCSLYLIPHRKAIGNGYSGQPTLQIFNDSDNDINIYPGMPICELMIFSYGHQMLSGGAQQV